MSAAVPAVLFLALAGSVRAGGWPVPLDRSVAAALRASRGTTVVHLLLRASGPVVLVATPGATALLTLLLAGLDGVRRRSWRSPARGAAAVAAVAAAVLTGKALVGRPGPPGTPQVDLLGYFPSGHTTTALVCSVTLALLVGEGRPACRRPLLAAAGAWTVLVGAAMVLHAYHWLSDVVAAALLGLVLLVLLDGLDLSRLPRRSEVRRWALVPVLALVAVLTLALAVVAREGGGVVTAAGRRAPSPLTAPAPDVSPPPAPASVGAARPRPRVPVVHVAPLGTRTPTDVLVTSAAPLPADVVARLVSATRARSVLAVAAGPVRLGSGHTRAVAVDPSTFRAWTPAGTADSDPVWWSVASGEASVAHVVARALHVPLGGGVSVGTSGRVSRFRVGSFTTTGLPDVGLVVDAARGARLGLRPRTGLLLSAPQTDPVVTAALAEDVVHGLAVALPVQVDRLASGRWVAPVAGRVTSPFGPRAAPLPGASTFHEGVDIGAPLGSPVYAMSDGQVLYAGPAAGFGQEVVLSHRGGITTVYGHVSRLLVTSGPVQVGQPIALVGSEGESTGPHLHAEVRVDDRPVDPLAWLQAHGVAVR